jgi:hypothetical protein
MNQDNLLTLILDYNMTKEEAKAWKIALMYIELTQKYFPNYKHYNLGKGDPRKTSLFRHCYKLVRECDKYLQNNEYRLYVTAQLQVMKNIDFGEGQAFVNPNCLVGPKAWNRWLLWKKSFERLQIRTEVIDVHSNKKIIKELTDTKKFLVRKFPNLCKQDIVSCLESRALFRWCARGDVSGYYLVLSPLVKACNENLLESFAIDLTFYQQGINSDIEAWFNKEFEYEYLVS